MFVLFMKWGVVGAKDKLDIIHIIKFILKVTNKYAEWTFHKWQVKMYKKYFSKTCIYLRMY